MGRFWTYMTVVLMILQNLSTFNLPVPQLLILFFTFIHTRWILKQADILQWQELVGNIFKEYKHKELYTFQTSFPPVFFAPIWKNSD